LKMYFIEIIITLGYWFLHECIELLKMFFKI